MIIQRIYFGASPVRRVYQNGTVIWEDGDPIAISAFAASFSDSKSYLSLLGYCQSTGGGESRSYGDGYLVVCPIFGLNGGGQSITYDSAFADILNAIPLGSVVYIKSYGKSVGYVFRMVSGSGQGWSKSYTECIGRIFRIVTAESRAYLVSHAAGACCVFCMVPGSGQGDSESLGHGTVYCMAFVSAGGHDTSYTYSKAIVNLLRLLGMSGQGDSESYCAGNNNPIPVVEITAIGESLSDGVGSTSDLLALLSSSMEESESHGLSYIIVNDAVGTNGEGESETSAEAVMNLLYIPLQNGSDLYVRQVYGAEQNGTDLEVI